MRLSLALAALLSLTGTARAETPPDWPDVVVFCEPTLKPAMTALGSAFRAQTGTPVRVFEAPGWMLVRQANHTRNDVLVLQGSGVMDEAARINAIRPETRTAIGGNRLVVARQGQGAQTAFAASIASEKLAAADQTVLATAGLNPPVQGVVGTADAVFLLETGAVGRALVFATDVAAHPDLSIAAVVPPETYRRITYLAAVSHDARGATPGKFLALLASPEGQKRLRDAGLEPAE